MEEFKLGDIIVGGFGDSREYLTYHVDSDDPITPVITLPKSYSKGCCSRRRLKAKRLATPQEIAWLKACEKADKYVDPPVLETELINSFQIF